MRFQKSAALVLLVAVSLVFAVPVILPEETPIQAPGGSTIVYRDVGSIDNGNIGSVIKPRDVDDSAIGTENIVPERRLRRDGPTSDLSGNGGHAFPGHLFGSG